MQLDRAALDETLIGEWRRLAQDAALPTQSPDFATALAATYLAGADVAVSTARDGPELTALLPLVVEPGPFGRLRQIGAPELGEPGDALCRDGAAACLLADALVRSGRPLHLDRLPAGSALIPALRAALRGRGYLSVRPATPTPTIALDARWTDPGACLGPRRAADFRRAARKAREVGEVAFEVLSPGPAEFAALFDEAIAIEARSWKHEHGSAIALDSVKDAFFRAYFRSACARGEMRIAFMLLDGRRVAMQLALEWSNRYWLFKIGFDEAFKRCSPGTLLMLHTLGWAAQRGLASYELLGEDEPWIARLWTRERHACVRVRTYPFNLAGAVAFAADALAWLRAALPRNSA